MITCPTFVIAGLKYLADEIETAECALGNWDFEPPIFNNGEYYKTDVFELRAYQWEDSEVELPNFKYGSFEVYWYKRLGRSTRMNKEIDANEFFLIIEECLESVRTQLNKT